MGRVRLREVQSWNRIVSVLAMLVVCPSPSAFALDPAAEPEDSFATRSMNAARSIYDMMSSAISAYRTGDKTTAVKQFEIVAGQGHAPAHWKLARMYAEGDGVEKDDAKAFRHYSMICNDNAEIPPSSPEARFVASSFVALGDYYLTGIANSPVKADPTRSRDFYTYAATYFGDPEAQFKLAGLHLDGIGGAADVKQAIRWLNLSAEKGFRSSQARLGALLFDGKGGARQKARGLMWLSLASEGADPEKDQWVIALHQDAFEQASDTDRIAAEAFRAQFENSRKK